MMQTDGPVYGGFWRRIAAAVIDLMIFVPLAIIVTVFGQQSPASYVVMHTLAGFVSLFYFVYLVGRFGGTPGKLLMRLRIRKSDGSVINYATAFLRAAPEHLFWLVSIVGLALGRAAINDPDFLALDVIERARVIDEHAPDWRQPVDIAQQLWFWSEFLVLLTNRRRRALHDFIAGTVVVVEPRRAG